MKGAWIVVAWLSVACLSSVAEAQPSPLAEAREAFERGMQELDEGRFRDATVSFERSFELAPRLPTAFNWALALRGLGQALEAERLYRRLLEGELGELREQDRASVESLLTEVQATISELHLTIEGPAELEARVDGVVIATTPGEHAIRLDPGEHGIVVGAHDHETAERRVSAGGAPIEVRVALEPLVDRRPGTLELRSAREDARFQIFTPEATEPTAEGPAPWRGELAPGRYAIVVHGAHGDRRTEIEVPAGRPVALTLDPPERSLVEEEWFWIVIGVGVAAVVAGAVGISRIEREVPPLENEVFPPVFALTAEF